MKHGGTVNVIGNIWQPGIGVCAQTIALRDYDLGNIGAFTRDNVEHWLALNAGDFQSIEDFEATNGETSIPWNDEESELAYVDAMYPSYDD